MSFREWLKYFLENVLELIRPIEVVDGNIRKNVIMFALVTFLFGGYFWRKGVKEGL
tara:strand:+ start:43 stop:210 length:168 start_codon:yes stop_codon:yes gene_type:complete